MHLRACTFVSLQSTKATIFPLLSDGLDLFFFFWFDFPLCYGPRFSVLNNADRTPKRKDKEMASHMVYLYIIEKKLKI